MTERLQDLLMPGLRHAHTLQQLQEIHTLTSLVSVVLWLTIYLVRVVISFGST